MYPATALTEETDCVPSARHSAARVLRAEAVYLELPVLIRLAPPVAGFASMVVRRGEVKRDGRCSLAATGRNHIPHATAEFGRRKKLRNKIFNGIRDQTRTMQKLDAYVVIPGKALLAGARDHHLDSHLPSPLALLYLAPNLGICRVCP